MPPRYCNPGALAERVLVPALPAQCVGWVPLDHPALCLSVTALHIQSKNYVGIGPLYGGNLSGERRELRRVVVHREGMMCAGHVYHQREYRHYPKHRPWAHWSFPVNRQYANSILPCFRFRPKRGFSVSELTVADNASWTV